MALSRLPPPLSWPPAPLSWPPPPPLPPLTGGEAGALVAAGELDVEVGHQRVHVVVALHLQAEGRREGQLLHLHRVDVHLLRGGGAQRQGGATNPLLGGYGTPLLGGTPPNPPSRRGDTHSIRGRGGAALGGVNPHKTPSWGMNPKTHPLGGGQRQGGGAEPPKTPSWGNPQTHLLGGGGENIGGATNSPKTPLLGGPQTPFSRGGCV